MSRYLMTLHRTPPRWTTWAEIDANTSEAVSAYMDKHPDSTVTHLVVGERAEDSGRLSVAALTQRVYVVKQETVVVSKVEALG